MFEWREARREGRKLWYKVKKKKWKRKKQKRNKKKKEASWVMDSNTASASHLIGFLELEVTFVKVN